MRPRRVPLGFVCGYPLQGGELYGGSMFARSAAADTRQGQATQRVNARFGSDALGRQGRESLGMAVCKKKYTPFVFPVTTAAGNDGGTVRVTAERRLGCRAHHRLRQEVIARHGLRPGWEPFGQWTCRKANELARKDTNKRNRRLAAVTAAEDGTTTTEDEGSLCSAEDATACVNPVYAANNFRSLCWNGNCLVKHESMYDDVEEECRQLQEQQEEEDAQGDDETTGTSKRRARPISKREGKRLKR